MGAILVSAALQVLDKFDLWEGPRIGTCREAVGAARR
jgi:hypothetical protein